ncbi:MAG: isoprenylcysteine carboxylmethyltransferase family protein [Desulfosarcinaceae bacterium]|nr:isoprenylcysteine carboxylmethyltransferase family protein [Desulfosarcinaceae bacterium]
MWERFLVIALPVAYLGSFIARNRKVKQHTGQRIRAADPLVNASIATTGASIAVVILCVFSEKVYTLMGPLPPLRSTMVAALGFLLFGAGIVLGWFVSAQLKAAWRVGVHADQQTELIQSGVYARVRNPYFGTYVFIFAGLLLVRPSLVSGALGGAAMWIFHRLVLKEERHLQRLHGEAYMRYRAKTGRYLPRW